MNIALIEFNPFHDECLYSQVAFIKSQPGHKVVLVYNHSLEDRINYWEDIDAALPVSSNQWGIGYFRILHFLNKHKVDRVVFNSLHSGQPASLLKLATPGKRQYYGLVHDLQDLNNKQAKSIQKKIAGYFVLNDYLLHRLENYSYNRQKFHAFYPIYFKAGPEIPLEKDEDELWITIPGLVEANRRDYQRLLTDFSKGALKENIKLIFLGKSTFQKIEKNWLKAAFKRVDKHNQCLFWDDFVDLPSFHSYLKKSDYLLPLLHANSKASDRYFDKITGLYNLGFAYGKRFLMEDFLRQFDDFDRSAVFYNENTNLIDFLNSLNKPGSASPYKDNKFSFNYQADNYLGFIGN